VTLLERNVRALEREANTCGTCRGKLNPLRPGTTSHTCSCGRSEQMRPEAMNRDAMIERLKIGTPISEICKATGKTENAVRNSLRAIGLGAKEVHAMQREGREAFEGMPRFTGPIRKGDEWTDPDDSQRTLFVFDANDTGIDLRSYSTGGKSKDSQEIVSETVLRQFWIFKDFNGAGKILKYPLIGEMVQRERTLNRA